MGHDDRRGRPDRPAIAPPPRGWASQGDLTQLMPGKRIVIALAAALAALLIVNHLQQRRSVENRLAAQEAAARLSTADRQRITYPVDAQPRLELPGGQSRPVRSLINLPKQLNYGEFAWDDRAVAAGPVWIRIDLTRQLVSVFRGEDEIGTAVILYGAPGKPTPKGAFRVIAKATDHYSRSYDAPMPFMLRLTDDGIAIHASQVRPNGATHGCLGVPLRFAEKLYSVAGMGTQVFILAEPVPAPGKTA
jgi:hypothetical protein